MVWGGGKGHLSVEQTEGVHAAESAEGQAVVEGAAGAASAAAPPEPKALEHPGLL